MPPRNWSAAVQLGSNIAAAVPGTAGTPITGQVGSEFPLAPPATLMALIGPAMLELSLNVGARKDVPAVARSVRPSPTFQLRAIFGFLVVPTFEYWSIRPDSSSSSAWISG